MLSSNFRRKVFEFCICFVAIAMPYRKLSSISIILLAFAWFLEGGLRDKLISIPKKPIVIFFILFYALFCFGLLYTDNISVGLNNLEKKLSLLILPIVIGTSKYYSKNLQQSVLFCFVLTCLMATLICLGDATREAFFTNDSVHFLHEELTSLIDFHPPYFGMYITFSIFIILVYLVTHQNTLNRTQVFFILILTIHFFIFLILLSARTVTLFLFLFALVAGLVLSYKKKRLNLGITINVILIAVTILIISNSAYLSDRIIRPLTSDIYAIDGGRETGLSIRLVKWKCSLEGLNDYPFLGTGTGDAIDYLVKCYEKENFWGMYPQYRFNSHNQFLETALTLGIIGLSLLLILVVLPFYNGWRSKNYHVILFVTLFCFCCLTESILERQWGVVFFTFFASLFMNPGKSDQV